MNPILRPAIEVDIADLKPLLKDLYRGDLGPRFSDVLDEYLRSESHHVILAAADGRAVGVLIGSYRLDIDHECRAGLIDAIVVAPNLRGRGIGKKLLGAFAQWARGRGCTVLQVVNGNREFFERLSFTQRRVMFHQASLDEATITDPHVGCGPESIDESPH